jgi:tetratricopeptide (TPR) repeat protein
MSGQWIKLSGVLSPKKERQLLWAGSGLLLVLGLAFLWRQCARNPAIGFLDGHGKAAWIVYPKPPEGRPFSDSEISAEFHRSFELREAPANSTLAVRAFRRFEIKVNGVAVAHPAGRPSNWKEAATFDVAGMLRAGTNEISVTVFNEQGPPALWLSLETGAFVINSGSDWEASLLGAAWRSARPASAPPELEPGNLLYGAERTTTGLYKSLPMLLLFTLVSCGIAFAAWRLGFKVTGSAPVIASPAKLLGWMVMVLGFLWAALFMNNLRSLPREIGFDVNAHLEYINYILQAKALPLANQGWEMYQPPLYYLLNAVIAAASGADAHSDWTISLIRLFGLATGVAHFVVVFFALRLLFPKQLGAQWFGMLLAAFLPEHLYISQYITNESLSAAWVTGALFFCLRLTGRPSESRGAALGVGLCLGAALLTKSTALLAVPFIAGVLVQRVIKGAPQETVAPIWTAVTVFLATLAVAGWHYLRVWIHFGTPFVFNWDRASSFAWWTDDGFQTARYFTGFGESLARPYFSAFHAFADGIYSTMWGDGFLGGVVTLDDRPPWNYHLMTAGFVLALLPTAIILIGFVACVIRFLNRPETAWFLLLGVAVTAYAAVAYMSLKLPLYCSAKAFYALITLLPMCAFGGAGWEVISRFSGRFRPVLYIAAGVWAINAYASFWIVGGSPATRAVRGNYLGWEGRHADAIAEFSAALSRDPHNVMARQLLVSELAQTGDLDKARSETRQLLVEDPGNVEGLVESAMLQGNAGQWEEAVQTARRAAAAAPDSARAYEVLSGWLAQSGKYLEAADAAREGLRVAPFSPLMHNLLATALDESGNPAGALRHYQFASDLNPASAIDHDRLGIALMKLNRLQAAIAEFWQACHLQPGDAEFQVHLARACDMALLREEAIQAYREALKASPAMTPALNELAHLLATSPDAKQRNGPEAVALAERACDLTSHKSAGCLATLADAYAEAGRFDDAMAAATQAMALIPAGSERSIIAQRVELYRAHRPHHQDAAATATGTPPGN